MEENNSTRKTKPVPAGTGRTRTGSAASGTGRTRTASSNRRPAAKRNVRRRRRSAFPVEINPLILIVAAAVIALILIITLGFKGCSGSGKNPESVSENYLKAAMSNKTKQMLKCYGVEGETPADVQQEMSVLVSYFQAHNPKELKIKASGTLYEENGYAYTYVIYDLILEDEQEYPCVKTFMTQKLEDKYVILPYSKITDALSAKAGEAYEKFMTTENYKAYTKAYDTFLKKHPGYEETVAAQMG